MRRSLTAHNLAGRLAGWRVRHPDAAAAIRVDPAARSPRQQRDVDLWLDDAVWCLADKLALLICDEWPDVASRLAGRP